MAFETGLSVARDEKAPANARASVTRTLLQAAGYLDKGSAEMLAREPHEMTPEELDAAIAKSFRDINRLTSAEGDDESDCDPDDVFT